MGLSDAVPAQEQQPAFASIGECLSEVEGFFDRILLLAAQPDTSTGVE